MFNVAYIIALFEAIDKKVKKCYNLSKDARASSLNGGINKNMSGAAVSRTERSRKSGSITIESVDQAIVRYQAQLKGQAEKPILGQLTIISSSGSSKFLFGRWRHPASGVTSLLRLSISGQEQDLCQQFVAELFRPLSDPRLQQIVDKHDLQIDNKRSRIHGEDKYKPMIGCT